MELLTTERRETRKRTNQVVEKIGCFGCGKIGVHLNKIYKTLDPNAYLCDHCFKIYVIEKTLNVGKEADRLLTLPVKRVGSCCHCGKELYTVGAQGLPPMWCHECNEELERLRAKVGATA